MANKYRYSTQKLAKSALLSFVYKMISLIISMYTSSLCLRVLGDYKYGVLASVLSIVSWIYTFDLGIGVGLKNKLAGSLGVDDYNAAKNYIGISYIFTAIISVCFIIIISVATKFWDIALLLNINGKGEDINFIIYVSLVIVCINFAVINVQSVIQAIQKAELENFYILIGQIIYVTCLYLAVIYSIDALLYVAVAQGICQLIKNIMATIHIFIKEKELRPNWFCIDWKYRHGIISFGVQAFAVQIAAAILNFTDNLVITKYIDASAVTPYSFCYSFFSIIVSIYTIVLTPFWTSYPMAYERKDVNWMKKSLVRTEMITLLFCLGTVLAIIIYKPFAYIWLGRSLDYKKYIIGFTALYFIIQMISTNFASVCMGTGNIKKLFFVNVFQAIANVPISIFLAVNCGFGVNGVILGSIVVMFIGACVAIVQGRKIIKEMEYGK